MHGKEETMNTSITPPEQPATVSEASLPPRGNHPKWMVPAIAAGCAIVLAAAGAGGYAWWSHDRLASASGECSAAHAKAVRAQGKLTVCFVKLGSAFCAVFFRSVGSGFSAGCAVSAAACLRCVVVVLLVYLVMRACSLR